ncbi:Hypothetical_protein [Hexamita inflata]|uniref:Hypothetical_protein n=1 Tax=Hexamita inflata TaxID=28002 RepID=A0ABP1H7C4_9EUKA
MEQMRLRKEQIQQQQLDKIKQGTLNLSRYNDYVELQKLRAEKKIQKVQKPMQFKIDADQADVDEKKYIKLLKNLLKNKNRSYFRILVDITHYAKNMQPFQCMQEQEKVIMFQLNHFYMHMQIKHYLMNEQQEK